MNRLQHEGPTVQSPFKKVYGPILCSPLLYHTTLYRIKYHTMMCHNIIHQTILLKKLRAKKRGLNRRSLGFCFSRDPDGCRCFFVASCLLVLAAAVAVKGPKHPNMEYPWFYIRNRSYGLGYILLIGVLGPLGLGSTSRP